MLRSMTGFGAASREVASGASLRLEIRSVNHRHLAVKMRLPDPYAAFETEVEGRVRAKCERGMVSVVLSAELSSTLEPARLDRALAKRYRKELDELAAELGLEPITSVDLLIGLPGILSAGTASSADEGSRGAILELLDKALARMLAMRATEGRALAADLRKNAGRLAQIAERIEKRMPRIVRSHRTALEKRVKALIGGKSQIASTDLAREVALLSDKLDVSEEISRLASHLSQLESLLTKGGRVGRQLDFLVQEIFREVNTIGSKCSDATVAHWVVEAKTYVERLREQVQNVE